MRHSYVFALSHLQKTKKIQEYLLI